VSESIFERLEGEWNDGLRHVTSHFRHESPSISGDVTQAPLSPGAIVSLLDTASTALAVARSAEEPLRVLLDEHFPAIITLGQQIENSRLIQNAIKAEEALPQPVKDAVSTLLEAHVGPAQPAAPEQPAEQQAA
jgi:hypothetical protein